MRSPAKWRGRFLGLTFACAAGLSSSAVPGQVPVFNASFESPLITSPPGILDDPTAAQQGAGAADSPWVFAGAAVIAAKDSRFAGLTTPQPPDGSQAGFVDMGGSFSQRLRFPAAGKYTLTYR